MARSANNTKSSNEAKPTNDLLTVEFPYEMVRWIRSQARKTGTTTVRVSIDPDDLVGGKIREGAEIEVVGVKRDGKSRGMRARHTAVYTKPLALTPDSDDD